MKKETCAMTGLILLLVMLLSMSIPAFRVIVRAETETETQTAVPADAGTDPYLYGSYDKKDPGKTGNNILTYVLFIAFALVALGTSTFRSKGPSVDEPPRHLKEKLEEGTSDHDN